MELEHFLSLHGVGKKVQLETRERGEYEERPHKTIKAYILAQDDTWVRVKHLQTEYLIKKSDIVSVETPSYIFGSDVGHPAELHVRGDAVIQHAFHVSAQEFHSRTPFAFQVPSWAETIERTARYTAVEADWLRVRGLLTDVGGVKKPWLAAEGTTTDIDTPGKSAPTYTGTATGNFPDSSIDSQDHTDDTEPGTSWDGLKNDDPLG